MGAGELPGRYLERMVRRDVAALALALPSDERSELADLLLASLAPAPELTMAEVERRAARALSGDDEGLDAETAIAAL